MLNDYIHSRFDPNSKSRKKLKPLQTKSFAKLEASKEPSSSSRIGYSPISVRIKDKIKTFIGHFDHAPDFLKDNQYILTGYRIGFHTPKKVLKSLFMIHNESMNIWTHLFGAIGLIILCFVLSFSMSTEGAQQIKQFVQVDVKELFDPLINKLPDFYQIEHEFSETLSQTKHDLAQFGEDTIHNLEFELESLVKEVENVKKNINPEAVGKLYTLLEEQLQAFSETCNNVKDTVMDKKKLGDVTNKLKKKLQQLQKKVIAKIDSSAFDWIDVYRFIKRAEDYPFSVDQQYETEQLSRWPIIVFLLSAVFCLLCSAIFHLFYCQSERANQIFLRLDYAGISILITGSCFPPLVYGFYCQPLYYQMYLSFISVASLIVFFVSLCDFIHSEPYRKMKDLMYGGLGIFAGLPMFHLIYLSVTSPEQSDNLNFVSSLPYFLAVGVSYLGGLVIYSFKIPERFSPGKFDIYGHSHQIWHCCVLLGVIFTYFVAFDNYYTRMQIPCLSCEQ